MLHELMYIWLDIRDSDAVHQTFTGLGIDGTISDQIFKYLRAAGYTGGFNDMVNAHVLYLRSL